MRAHAAVPELKQQPLRTATDEVIVPVYKEEQD